MQQFGRRSLIGKRLQCNLQSRPAAIFHRRNTVRVIRDQNNSVDCFGCTKGGDVEADFHVHTLLLKVGCEVIVGHDFIWGELLLWLEASEFQDAQSRCEKVAAASWSSHSLLLVNF